MKNNMQASFKDMHILIVLHFSIQILNLKFPNLLAMKCFMGIINMLHTKRFNRKMASL